MKREGFVMLFVLLLFASVCVPSTTAIPASRSLRSITETVPNQNLYDEFQMKGSVGVEVADYSGAGANNHHDPTPPAGNS